MKNRQKGFSFIELILYMGLLVGFLVVLTDIFVSSLDVQTESEATSVIQEDGRYLLARLSYDVGRSQVIVQPAVLGQISPVLQLTIDGVTYTYGPSGTNLVLIGPLGTQPLNGYGSMVSAFSAQRLGDADGKPTVRILFTVTSTTSRPKGHETKSFQTTLGI